MSRKPLNPWGRDGVPPYLCKPRGWLTGVSLVVILLGGGCTQTEPSNQTETDSQSQANSESTQPTPTPLSLALATPEAIANPTIQQYLDKLSGQGSPAATQGVWIQSDTTLIANHQGTVPLSAASITKVATSLATLKTLGPDHRFKTQIGATGPIKNGVLTGDLVIQGGADPFFVWEEAIALGNLLQKNGIQRVTGNLVIVGPFYMNYETDPLTAGELLKQGLNQQLWSGEAAAQYDTLPTGTPQPQVEIEGTVQTVAAAPNQVKPLVDHASFPLAELLKKMNRYSNNQMAEILAESAGGATKVAQIAAQEAGVPVTEIQLVNGSGLAIENRISPRASCGMFQAIARLLQPHNLTIADIFAVVGADEGILDERSLPPLAVVKSGTLNGVSALAGALPTQNNGVVWFSILNVEGNSDSFRVEQEVLLQKLLSQWGEANQTPLLLQPSVSRQDQTSQNEWRG